jgi:transcriptional regulator with XRE-family HTH domain
MRYNDLRVQLREARRSRSLSQAELAACSGASRIAIARMEASSGRDVRLVTIARVCAALDLRLTAQPAAVDGPALETLLVRERERSHRLERRVAHAQVAARLLAVPRQAEALVARARANVERWERERLCSRHYIVRWRALLTGHPARVARALLISGPWQDALFQNSPWAFALKKLRSFAPETARP